MTILDTHIWVWWVQEPARLSASNANHLALHQATGLGVSVISIWEIAMLVSLNRLTLPKPVEDWVDDALAYPGIRLLPLTPKIAIESNRLPDPFHLDPADRMLVATSRLLNIPMVTQDRKFLAYPHVVCLS